MREKGESGDPIQASDQVFYLFPRERIPLLYGALASQPTAERLLDPRFGCLGGTRLQNIQ